MTKLDLHGIRHREVDRLVENFILLNQKDFPIEIICGNSEKMIGLVLKVTNRLECDIDKSRYGAVIVRRFL